MPHQPAPHWHGWPAAPDERYGQAYPFSDLGTACLGQPMSEAPRQFGRRKKGHGKGGPYLGNPSAPAR
eukprot:8830209-Pyramimonas_sp.AAC.1